MFAIINNNNYYNFYKINLTFLLTYIIKLDIKTYLEYLVKKDEEDKYSTSWLISSYDIKKVHCLPSKCVCVYKRVLNYFATISQI